MNEKYDCLGHDPEVEDAWLCVVNDQRTHEIAVRHIQQCSSWISMDDLKSLIRRAAGNSKCSLSRNQLERIWTNIKFYLLDYKPQFFHAEFKYLTWSDAKDIERYTGQYIAAILGEREPTTPKEQYVVEILGEFTLKEMKAEINQHIENAEAILAEVEMKFNQTLEDTKLMNDLNQLAQNLQSSPLTSVEFVYGKPINELTASDCLTLIKKANDDIANFKAFGVESTYITGEIAKIEMAKKKLAERLDTFTDPKSVVEVVGQK